MGTCPWEEDLQYVRAVCDQAGVELQVIPLQKEYHERVIAYTIEAVKEGRTPNPDMLCNTMIKFGAFYETVGKQYDMIATGHYAQVTNKDGVYYLAQTPDAIKDQTYFLARLSQEQLSRVMFPIGEYTKEQVRQLAQKFDLPNKERKDSQGLCFLGKIKFRDFIEQHVGKRQGDLVEYETGAVLGVHDGFWFYTVGQRQGIGLSGGPWYVVSKDSERNVVFISKGYHTPDKQRDSFLIEHCYWFNGVAPLDREIFVKLRHGAHMHRARVVPTEKGMQVNLFERDQGIAAGQFAVFYENGLCLGSAVIGQLS